jgi:electron transfer flavoprotein beta subunit
MNIVVCIKQVPDTTEIKLDPLTGTMIRTGVPSIMNPDDKGGLEVALRLRDTHGAHVTVITMGPPQAEETLREALAMGADRAILLTDRKFAGADTLATSNALAGALRRIDHDMIITGRQAIDGDTAQVGPQLAEHLDLPQVTWVEQVDVDPADGNGVRRVTARKATEEGYQVVETTLPCLLTVVASAVKPRYMSVAGIMQAFNRPVEVWGRDQIEVDEARIGLAGSPTRVARSFGKTAKAAGTLHDDLTPAEAADLIVAKLKERFVI